MKKFLPVVSVLMAFLLVIAGCDSPLGQFNGANGARFDQHGNGSELPTEEDPNENDPNEDDPAEDDPAEDDPAEDDPAEDDPTEDDPTEDDPTEDDPTEDDPAEDDPTEDDPTEDDPTEDDPTEDDPNEDDPTEDEPTEDDPTEDDPTEDDPAEDDPTEDDPTEDDPTEDDPTEDDPTEDDPTEDDPTEDDPTEDDPTEDDPTGLYQFAASRNTLIDTGLALKDGEVWVWGFRGSGQQGNGVSVVSNTAAPNKVTSLSNIKTVTGSAYTLVAIDKDGNAYGWGQNLYGAAGVGQATGIVNSPRKINIPVPVDQIAAGEYFFIARGTDGSVWTWGHNLYGQLGTGSTGNQASPVKVNIENETARLIGGAYEGAFVVTDQGNVWAWGDNEASGLGFPGTNYGVQQIRRSPARADNLKSYAPLITFIAGGNGWGQALLDDGRVIGWGLNASLGQGTTSTGGSGGHTNGSVITVVSNVVSMHCRYVGTVAITGDNTVLTWGQTGGSAFPTIYGAGITVQTPPAGVAIVEVGGGKEHVYYRTADGKVWGAGYGAAQKLLLTSGVNQKWPGVTVNLP
ncbi:MAG: hypothetical protein FWG99_08355 [Treponema sp.]|nr:hypothetical protein [Treponema sp.]